MREITTITEAVTEPLLLADCYAPLRAATGDGQDTVITNLITVARQATERINGRHIASKTRELALCEFPECADFIELEDPLLTVTSFTYKDSAGTTTTLTENTDFYKDISRHPGVVHLPYGGYWPVATLWPSSPVKIRYTVGMSTCPTILKQYMLYLITEMYERRLPTDVGKLYHMSPFVERLAEHERLYQF